MVGICRMSPPAVDALWRPPAPPQRSALMVGLRIALGLSGDLLETLPRECYAQDVVRVPIGRRPVFIVNHPEMIRRIMIDEVDAFPKSDLMVSALAPLLGEGVLISAGEVWSRDRVMLAPAFEQLRLGQMFGAMKAAVDACVTRLSLLAVDDIIDLEECLSHVTADIMMRTLFSQPIDGDDASRVFGAFMRFQRRAPQFNLRVVLASDPEHPDMMPAAAMDDARVVRDLMAALVQDRVARVQSGEAFVDFAQALLDARDPQGSPFSEQQLIDQLAVFFLAGHETTASSLSWTIFILSQQPAILAAMRDEIATELGSAPFGFGDVRRLGLVRQVFREGLRLYPPAAFLTRRALRAGYFGSTAVPAGSFVVVSPWLVHRHERYWPRADRFDPSRFDQEQSQQPGTYIPFGMGPRVCIGAGIAQLEASLILTELMRRFEFEPVAAEDVKPVSRVTIRPARGIRVSVRPLGVSVRARSGSD